VVHWPAGHAAHDEAPGEDEMNPAAHGEHVDDPAADE
jgi:hypothetical protein